MRLAFGLLIALLACDATAQQQVVIYRCTDANGAVTLQNDVPCPKGSKQVKRVVDVPSAAPPSTSITPTTAAMPTATPTPASATTAPPSTAAATPTPPSAAQPVAALVPPPPLYRCANLKREVYFSDTDLQPQRCVPMQAVGLDGNPATGAGTVCEMMRDPCKPIAEKQLCEGWRLRAEEAQATARFGTGEQAMNAKSALQRSQTVLRESCAAP